MHASGSALTILVLVVVEQEVGALAIVLERTPYPLAIELAAVAARHAPQIQPPWALQPWLQVPVGMRAGG